MSNVLEKVSADLVGVAGSQQLSGTQRILKALPGQITVLCDERASYGDPVNHVTVDVQLYVRSVDAFTMRSFLFPTSLDVTVRLENAKLLALADLNPLAVEAGEKIPVIVNPPAGIGQCISYVPPTGAAQPPQAEAPAPAKAKRARKEATVAAEPATPPAPPAPPPVQTEQQFPADQSSDEPAGSDEPEADSGAPQWPHQVPAEDVLVAYGAARGQKVGIQSLDKLRWYSGTVPGRIRDKEQRDLTEEERLMVHAAAYLVDLNEWRKKNSGK